MRPSELARRASLLLLALGVAAAGCASNCPNPDPVRGVAASSLAAAGAMPPRGGTLASAPPGVMRTRPGRVFTANGVRLWYDVLGEKGGPPLVVISGGPGFDHTYMVTSDAWDRLARGRQVVVYDQRGTGRSEPYRAGAANGLDAHVADLEALRVELHAEKLDLAGHSWGGYLSMAYATRHPDRVAHLVLCDSAAPRLEDTRILLHEHFPDESDRYEATALAVLDGGAPDGAAPDGGGPEGVRAALRDLAAAMFYAPENRDEFLARNADLSLNFAMGEELSASIAKLDLWAAVRALRVPALVVNGRYDANVAPETARSIHLALAGSRLRYFERSGHFPFIEEPDLFADVVGAFLEGR